MAISTIGTDALASAAVTSAKLASGAPSRSQLPAGTVLQVVSTPRTPNAATQGTTLNTWINTYLVGTITPTSASSKILIIVADGLYFNNGGGSFPNIALGLKRTVGGASSLVTSQSYFYFDNRGGGTLFGQQQVPAGMSYTDSPATTSAVTYTVQYYLAVSSGSGLYGGDADSGTGGGALVPTITMIEVAA